MNQNLLIVDDEYDALAWLEEMFKYEFDREIDVYSATTAMDALKLLNSVKFDTVLTDIRMPGMDGIALFQEIKKNWPRCKVVFLTGYRNFDDMYRVINNKDVRFILKSERDEIIKKAVRDAMDEFQKELEQETLNKNQKEHMEKIRYWMLRDFIKGVLNGKICSLEEMKRLEKEVQMSINFQNQLLMTLIRIDPEKNSSIDEPIEETEAIHELLRRNLPQDLKICLCAIENLQVVLFVQPIENQKEEWKRIFTVLKGTLEYVQVIFRRNYGNGFSAAISSTPVCYNTMAKMFIGLRQIIVGYLGAEKDALIHAEYFLSMQEEKNEISKIRKVPLLRSYLELKKRTSYFELLNLLCEELIQAQSKHDSQAMELYYSISIMLLQFINENRLNEKIAFNIGIYKLTKVDEHESWIEAAQYLFDVSVVIFDLLGNTEQVLSDKALQRVKDYISDNLFKDLALTNLAEIGGFNASYLSRLFKQNVGVSISDYIYQKRMELAVDLLINTNQKIQDIGIKAGYPSAQSFTRAFRNYKGISPIEYRELYKWNVEKK